MCDHVVTVSPYLCLFFSASAGATSAHVTCTAVFLQAVRLAALPSWGKGTAMEE